MISAQETNKEVIELASQFAHSNGILKKIAGVGPSSLSCTLLPSPFPRTSLTFAEQLQEDFNLLFHKVSRDHDFLESVISHILTKDSYLERLWDIYTRVRGQSNRQNIVLGLNRSDYMLHNNDQLKHIDCLRSTRIAASHPVDLPENAASWSILSLRQVEFNLMASSFCGLAQRMVEQHRTCLSLCGFNEDQLKRVPDCPSADRFTDALWKARNCYVERISTPMSIEAPSPNARGAILMIISAMESNVYDQCTLLAALLRRHPQSCILVRTFEDLLPHTQRMCLNENNLLFIDGIEVAVIYFRHGYAPNHFPTQEIWDVKYELERSMAIKCPCVQYMLANTKLVQAALSKPDRLARFIQPESPTFERVQSTFAKQYTLSPIFGLSNSDEIARVVDACERNPGRFVLKPQREGGGNNYFDDNMVCMLKKAMKEGEGHAYVIMERLYPFVVENYPLHSDNPGEPRRMVSELGIFGAFIAVGDEVVLNEHSGHLLRTKLIESNEGGIAAGFGFIDSPFLV